ncbi:MAG: DUF5103 domain-containing protein [Cyclobacteriaceae bacterium]
MQRKVNFIILFTTLISGALISSAQTLRYEDKIYDENVKSVQLYPLSQERYPEYQSAIIDVRQQTPLQLKFDELYYDYSDYIFKLIRCTADWKKSNMVELEYLFEYNEFPIQNYQYSQNTKVPYTSYEVTLPRVKQPGNYLLAVYRRSDGEQLILTKRFVVYTNSVEISPVFGNRIINTSNPKMHQFEFKVNYSNMETFSPTQDFKLVIRQNQRWDNMLTDLTPSMIREDIGTIEFRGFSGENALQAGNEFRLFDLRGYTYRGQNISSIDRKPDVTEAYVIPEESRNGLAYGIYEDQNGKYYNQTLEPGSIDLEADYVKVNFSLRIPKVKEKLYVLGAYNIWQKEKDNLMTYNPSKEQYQAQILIKQGFYNYIYWLDNDTPWNYEGSHFETENQYEIFVYYRAPGTQFDIPVGYLSLFSGIN